MNFAMSELQSNFAVFTHARFGLGPQGNAMLFTLVGVIGILVQEKNSLRVVVNVELLHRSVAVEISRERLTPAKEAWRRPVAAAAR